MELNQPLENREKVCILSNFVIDTLNNLSDMFRYIEFNWLLLSLFDPQQLWARQELDNFFNIMRNMMGTKNVDDFYSWFQTHVAMMLSVPSRVLANFDKLI
jgi:hypothetical protein